VLNDQTGFYPAAHWGKEVSIIIPFNFLLFIKGATASIKHAGYDFFLPRQAQHHPNTKYKHHCCLPKCCALQVGMINGKAF